MRSFDTIGVVGAGTMGAALAQKFATEGMKVVLLDREERFLDRGMAAVNATLQEGVERSIFKPEQKDAIVGRINPTTDMNDMAPCQLIIEAVFEDRRVKEKLLRDLSATVPADTILATNTSSFLVTELAAAVTHPERFVGLHFFYHAAKNRLVEVIKGAQTSQTVMDEVQWLMELCGKDPIVCADAHGFTVNRFFVPWLNEAVRLFADGLAGKGAIDAIACKLFGCGMGPFALMNATGIPIALHAQRTLEEAFGRFYTPAKQLVEQVDAGGDWDLSDTVLPDDDTRKMIEERFLGSLFLVCGQLLDEQVCPAGVLSRGANIGLRWRQGPLELYHRYGEGAIKELTTKFCQSYDVPVPDSLAPQQWKGSYVSVSRKGRTGKLVITRPEGLNALNPEVVNQIDSAFDELDGDPALERIIITGTGKAFVAGADIKFFLDHIKSGTLEEIVAFTARGQQLFQRIDDSKKQIVMVLNGLTLGGGLELALAGDVIVASPKAMLAFPETGIGIYPGLGGMQRSVKKIGKGLAKYLIYTGQMLNARKAAEIGLVDLVVDAADLPEIHAGHLPEIPPHHLGSKWQEIAAFFDEYKVAALLSGDDVQFQKPEWERIMKQIHKKAPIAMKLAEALIDRQDGPESELEYLTKIFSTEDALNGLRSVGGPPPEYQGK